MWWIDRWRQSDAFARMTAEERGLYRNLCDEVVLRADGVIPDDALLLASGDPAAWARSGDSVLSYMARVAGGWTLPETRKPMIEPRRWVRRFFDEIKRHRSWIPVAIRRAVFARDRACLACGTEDRPSLDHIVPYSLGGPDTIENLRRLCVPCNSRRGNRI